MGTGAIEIRALRDEDGEALRDIYNYYIANTPITFDIAPRSREQWSEWMARYAGAGPCQCFVALAGGVPIGWASSAPLKDKAAYATSVETTIYTAPGRMRAGTGRRLYAHLFDALAHEDVHRAFAAITAPNPASVHLHETFGFRFVGRYPEVGRKFDAYHDVDWYWRPVPLNPLES